jgi:methylmalonyl-CoA/ethylmalonyl-CoA epimerase
VFQGISHVVIAVEDLDAQVANYEKILGQSAVDRRESPERGMKVAFFRFPNGTHIELVSNIGEDGPIAKRLRELGEGIHFYGLHVDDLGAKVGELKAQDIRVVSDPTTGIAFVHPSELGGALMRLI